MPIKNPLASILACVAVFCLAAMPCATASAASEFHVFVSSYVFTERTDYKGIVTQIERAYYFDPRYTPVPVYYTRTVDLKKFGVPYNFSGDLWYMWVYWGMPEFSRSWFEIDLIGQRWDRVSLPSYHVSGLCDTTLTIYNPNPTRETCTLRLGGVRLGNTVYGQTTNGLPSSIAPYNVEKVNSFTLDGYAQTTMVIQSTDMVHWTGGTISPVLRTNN